MALLNTNRRWVYKGSLTVPPCTSIVVFNVLSTVYPIKQRHLQYYLQQLAQTTNLDQIGSYRAIQ